MTESFATLGQYAEAVVNTCLTAFELDKVDTSMIQAAEKKRSVYRRYGEMGIHVEICVGPDQELAYMLAGVSNRQVHVHMHMREYKKKYFVIMDVPTGNHHDELFDQPKLPDKPSTMVKWIHANLMKQVQVLRQAA